MSEAAMATAPSVESPPLSEDWVSLTEAEAITGIQRDALYQRIKTGSIPAELVRKDPTHPGPRQPYQIHRSALAGLTPDAPRRSYNRKSNTAPASGPQPTGPDVETAQHTAYCSGYITAWLDMYAAGNGIDPRVLKGSVLEVVKRGVK